MLLKDLIDKGGFVSGEPVKKSVEWMHEVDGEQVTEQFDIWVLQQSFGTVEKFWAASDDRSRAAIAISECLRFGKNAEERMSYDDAFRLSPGLGAVFMRAYNEVNGSASSSPKTSRPPKKSGAN